MKYDLHIHTHYSSCSNLQLSKILKIAKKLGLDGIAITDHNTFKGAQKLAKLNKDKNFEVIKGIELSTNKAHLLALYLNEEIKTNNFFEALDLIKKQDAIAVIAHPCSALRVPLTADIKKIKAYLETCNGRAFPFENKKAAEIAKKYKIAATAGSDAHFDFEIGNATTLFNDDLRKALKKRKTIVKQNKKVSIKGLTMSVFNKIK